MLQTQVVFPIFSPTFLCEILDRQYFVWLQYNRFSLASHTFVVSKSSEIRKKNERFQSKNDTVDLPLNCKHTVVRSHRDSNEFPDLVNADFPRLDDS